VNTKNCVAPRFPAGGAPPHAVFSDVPRREGSLARSCPADRPTRDADEPCFCVVGHVSWQLGLDATDMQSQKRANIALVETYMLHIGGEETYLLSLMRHVERSLFDLVVIGSVSPQFCARVRQLGVHVEPWGVKSPVDLWALWRLLRLLRRHQVGLIHVQSTRAGVVARLAGLLLGMPVVLTVHMPAYSFVEGDGLGAHWKRRFYRWVERVLNRHLTDTVVYVSSRVYQDALAMGVAPPDRAVVVSNGIDLSPYRRRPKPDLRAQMKVPPSARVVSCVGRLHRQKGVDVLLRAASGAALQGQDWRLWVIGDGPERAALEAQADELGLADRVCFLGYREDVPDLLMASDVFVLASRYEAMPMAVVEAMAAGLPCVVTDVGESPRLVEQGVTGLVVKPEDADGLAAALAALLSDPERCRAMGEVARRRAEQYSAQQMVRQTEQVYAAALARRR